MVEESAGTGKGSMKKRAAQRTGTGSVGSRMVRVKLCSSMSSSSRCSTARHMHGKKIEKKREEGRCMQQQGTGKGMHGSSMEVQANLSPTFLLPCPP